ncbi:MBL fold metallo-hydrolase [Engelhardtia mirabilis]|uniref:Beta-lactamase hydrolase-like protein n=1 Tax=Engelhardtia mirabilis TaxID=2528011 RepID=A0A518BGL8_9BACT|nr:Beta-lactamase hydrolase-like protein [Planctomycetes bacterium Pla133]QDV00433.1 Beta-lactamase hydrolase-like protein [Planctomycetes bacterium Pla86]
MILEQYYLQCLAHASYLVGDEAAGVAAVVDPQRDVQQYLDDAKAKGLRIEYVLLTHFHADFVSGHLEIARRTGARIALSARGETEYPSMGLADGESIQLGKVRIQGLQTPGHTPESMTFLVFDEAAGGDVPYAALTGDTLFIGDVGRPDLLASIGFTREELGGMLYDSLHEKLMKLPDETLVYPAHGAGSMCGKALSKETVSTIGEQRANSYALQPMSKQAFIELVSEGQPEAPKYFVHDAILNRKLRKTLDQSLEQGLRALRLEEVVRLANAGAQLVDLREADEFAAGFLRGSLDIGLSGKFATWAGYVLDLEAPIILVGDREQVEEAAVRLGRVGLDQLAGYLDGGFEGVLEPELVGRFERLCVAGLRTALNSDQAPFLVDVRTASEFAEGHLDGALNIPLNHIEEQLDEIPRDRDVVLLCRSGYRSALGASLLLRAGFDRVRDLQGGMQAYDGVACTAGA